MSRKARIPKTPLPLVFVLHGGTQSAKSAERMSGMSAKADQDDFIVSLSQRHRPSERSADLELGKLLRLCPRKPHR